jgi:hypothetical protein
MQSALVEFGLEDDEDDDDEYEPENDDFLNY